MPAEIDSEILVKWTLGKMCNLLQSIVDVLDCVPMRELEEYMGDRKGKRAAPVKRAPQAVTVLA